MLIIHQFPNLSQKRGEEKYSSLTFVRWGGKVGHLPPFRFLLPVVIPYKPESKNEWSNRSIRKMCTTNWVLEILWWSISLWWRPQKLCDGLLLVPTEHLFWPTYSHDAYCLEWLLEKNRNKLSDH